MKTGEYISLLIQVAINERPYIDREEEQTIPQIIYLLEERLKEIKKE